MPPSLPHSLAAATVPAAFLVPEWDFMYFVEVTNRAGRGTQWPDLAQEAAAALGGGVEVEAYCGGGDLLNAGGEHGDGGAAGGRRGAGGHREAEGAAAGAAANPRRLQRL